MSVSVYKYVIKAFFKRIKHDCSSLLHAIEWSIAGDWRLLNNKRIVTKEKHKVI